MKKKVVLALGIIALLTSISFVVFDLTKNKKNKEVYITEYELSNNDTIQMKTYGTSLEKQQSETHDRFYSTYDKTTTYTLKDDEFKIVERVLPNEDLFVFIKWVNNGSKQEEERIELSLNYETNQMTMSNFDQYEVEHEHDSTFGVDTTTYPVGLFSFEHLDQHRDIMLSKNYVSRKLTKQYEDGTESFIRELLQEYNQSSLMHNDDSVSLSFEMTSSNGEISENWLMVSDQELFEEEEELAKWIELSNKEYQDVNTWYVADGVYSKIPWSIEPFAEMGYGKSVLRFKEDTAANRYRVQNERYYYNLLVNSLVSYANYPKNEDSVYETHYTSTWLKDEYGTKAPYVDTRHNEMSAIYIDQISELLSLEDVDNQLIQYADYLLKQEELENVLYVPDDNGYFILDYYDYDTETQLTHTSLNHALGGMNLLFDVHLDTSEEKYYEVANQIRKAIKATEDDWIRDDHDLWYEINTDFAYTGRDYPLLTLRDLLDAEYYWQTIHQTDEHIFSKLVRSKMKYLQNNEVELDEEIREKLKKANYDLP
ncbi:hypothetical protein [Gracilibacillus sp. YIM 98692]|uniref:hypothetical protein n=1 Tax=Gracilibacillus sp. YIM 98692 TaxID=2663532 RepID=UPI0013D1AED0|nr:hypothetical protein [Gracilibacillus sp. YIM 98692]